MKTLGRILSYTWRALDGLRKVLHLIVLLVAFAVVFATLSPSLPIVPAKAVLVLNPQGVLVEQLAGGPLERAVAEAMGQERLETQLRDLVDAIDLAKDDHRIQALFIDPVNLRGAGLAKLDEVALAIQRFRAVGKPVIAFGEAYDQAQYYLAAQADEVYLDPKGLVFIDGFGYYRMFFKDAIDRLGVDVNVFRAGKFKSYTDQFSRNDMSEQEREESRAWLDVLWTSYQNTVTQARGLATDAISTYVEHIVPAVRKTRGDLAAIAVEQRLVTELKTRQQVNQRLIALTGEDDEHSFRGIDFHEYLQAEQARRQLSNRARAKIGVVIAAGEILDGSHPPGVVGGDSTAQLLKEARFDDDIKAVVLRIDSPGGSVFASEVIRREVELLKAAGKPVIASMSSTAASGGYYIAMNADEIWAARTTLTGSIGVFAVLPTFERALAKWLGIHTDGIGTTQLSGGFSLERSLTPAQRELLQLSVDHEYREFIQLVADARGKTPEAIDAIAQGRVWAGVDAQVNGLIDKIGSFREAVEAAAARAQLKEYGLKVIETEPTWRQVFAYQVRILAARIAHAIAPERITVTRLLAKLSPLDVELRRLARFTDPLRAYYYCVCTVE